MISHAQLSTTDLGGQIGGGGGVGPFANIGNEGSSIIATLATGISNLIAFFTIIAGLWFGFQLILGSFQWITSGGDKTRIESARNRLVHAFLGLILVVTAWAIIAILGKFFGLDILLTDPEKIACQINPTCSQ